MSSRAELLIVAAVIALSAPVTGADESLVRMSLWEVTETVIEHSRPDLAGATPAGTTKTARYCQPDSSSYESGSSFGMTGGLHNVVISAYRLTQQPGRRSLQFVHMRDPRTRYISPWYRFDSVRGWVSSDRRDARGNFDSDFSTDLSSTMQSLERSLPEGEPMRERRKAHAKRLGDCPPGTPPGRIKNPVVNGGVAPSAP